MFKKIILALLLVISIEPTYAFLYKSPWPKWEVTSPLSTKKISHHLFQEFLNRRVVTNEEGINLVDYAHMTKRDLELLNEYVHDMSEIKINDYNRFEQLAFWINLYNALILQVMAKNFPVSTIQEISISPGLFSIGPWGAYLIQINSTALTLDDINNRIIRPIWNDVRVHYALSNASIGAPNISKEIYEAKSLENQLNTSAITYINSLRGVNVTEGRLIVSKIYDWYEEDFGSNRNDIILHLLQFAKKPLRSQLKHINKIDGYNYNWHSNSTSLEDL